MTFSPMKIFSQKAHFYARFQEDNFKKDYVMVSGP